MSWQRAACAALLALTAMTAAAQAPKFGGRFDSQQLILAPDCLALEWSQKPGDSYGCSQAQVNTWRDGLRSLNYDDRRYRDPRLQWAASSFVQPQAMVHDRYLYDRASGRYTVDRYLDDLERRYGGIDSVLLWSVYPNIGIDERNQLQMIEQLPGGVAGVRQLVADFQRRGVRVLFPIMPWDTGTHPLPGSGRRHGRADEAGRRRWRQRRHHDRRARALFAQRREARPPAGLRARDRAQGAMAAHLVSPDWEPLAATEQFGVLASRWPLAGRSLWTLVNRNEYGVGGTQLVVPATPGLRYFELYRGRELQPQATADGRLLLSIDIEAKGFAAVLATPEAPDDKLSALLLKMQAMTAWPLDSFEHRWKPALQRMRAATPPQPALATPPGMRAIPGGRFELP